MIYVFIILKTWSVCTESVSFDVIFDWHARIQLEGVVFIAKNKVLFSLEPIFELKACKMPVTRIKNGYLSNKKETSDGRDYYGRMYGFRLYGGSTLKRSPGPATLSKPLYGNKPAASNASFNPRTPVLPKIEVTARKDPKIRVKPISKREKMNEENTLSLVPVEELVPITLTLTPPPTPMNPADAKKPTSNIFTAAFWITKLIRKRNLISASQGNIFTFGVSPEVVQSRSPSPPPNSRDNSDMFPDTEENQVLQRPVSAAELIPSTPSEIIVLPTPRSLTLPSGSDTTRCSSLSTTREKVSRKNQDSNNWSLLRNRMAKTKVYNGLNTLKFTVNQQKLTVLKALGEGGYAKVYEVFNENNELFALKVVDLSESKMKEELLQEIEFLKKFKNNKRVIQVFFILILEKLSPKNEM